MKTTILTAFSIFLLASCSNNGNNTISGINTDATNPIPGFHLLSNAFKPGDSIPSIYTCDSSNISPQLHWNNPLKNTATFALILDDPDAPMGIWVHWVLYNIPASDTTLQSNFPADTLLANGTQEGISSFKIPGYGGPCPPNAVHHYHFKLYALDARLKIHAGLTKGALIDAMKGHILAETELVGLYKRKKNN